nr:sugar-binding protein [Kineosporia rhizophila]
MGRDADLKVSGATAAFTVGPDPVYLSAAEFPDLTAAPAPAVPADPIDAEDFTAAERVVIQPVFDAETSKDSQLYGYGLDSTATTTVTAEVYNFNDTDVSAEVAATAQGGWQVAGAAQQVTIPAGGKTDVPFEITAGNDLQQTIADLTIEASVDGKTSSPAVAELRPRASSLTLEHAIDGADDVVKAEYTNTTDAAQHVSEASWTFGEDTETLEVDLDVAPGATVSLLSGPAPAGVGEVTYTAALTIDGAAADVSASGTLSAPPWLDVPRVPKRTIEIDGVRDDLDALPSTTLRAPGVRDASLAAKTWFTWDDDNLYLTAEVADDIHIQPFTGNATWQADGLQFAVAPNWPGERDLRPEIQERIEFGFALTPEGPQLYRYASGSVAGHLTSADVAAVRDATTKTTVYEAAVPWSLLEPIGISPASAASLSIVANDTDGDGTRGWVQWGGGITTAKDSELFEPVIFAADANNAVASSANVRAQCWGDGPALATHAWNDAATPVDVRFSTSLGDHVVHDLAAKKGGYHAFRPDGASVPAWESLTVVAGDAGTRAFANNGKKVTCE